MACVSFLPKTRNSAGFVFLRFENTQSASCAQRALHGRWFAGKMITATFMVSYFKVFSFICGFIIAPYLFTLGKLKKGGMSFYFAECRCLKPMKLSSLTADRILELAAQLCCCIHRIPWTSLVKGFCRGS